MRRGTNDEEKNDVGGYGLAGHEALEAWPMNTVIPHLSALSGSPVMGPISARSYTLVMTAPGRVIGFTKPP
jgi:hypothetical protein